METPLPTRSALKAQAKRLRAAMADSGQIISHGQSLEAIAQQWGARNWNTINALAQDDPIPSNQLHWAVGQSVSGRYLGHQFEGRIKSARSTSSGYWTLTLIFNTPIDVVDSNHFSNIRRQVNCIVGPDGRTARKTSDGQPHVVLFP